MYSNKKIVKLSLCVLFGLLLMSNCTPFTSIESQASSTNDGKNATAVAALTEEDLPFGFVTVAEDDPAASSFLNTGQAIAESFIFAEITSITQYRFSENDNFALITSGTIEPVVPIERAVFDRRLLQIIKAPGKNLPSTMRNSVLLTPDTPVTPIQLFLTGTICQVTCGNDDLLFDLFIGRSKSTVFFVYYLHNPGIDLPIDIFELSKLLVFKNNKLRQVLE